MLPQRFSGFWRPIPLRAAALALCAAATVACDKMPLVAPSGATMTLVSTTNVVPVNGSAEIVAIVTEGRLGGGEDGGTTAGGTPVHNGTVVTFVTTLGRLEPAEALTEGGRARTRLIADGRSGIARITAFSGSATETIEINIGAAAAARVALTASPQSLPGTGGTATITARVEDDEGNGLGGVPLTFSTSQGSLSVTNAVTNDAGVATTQLSTSREAVVTASAGGATGEVTVTVRPRTSVTITPPPQATVGVPASFTITPGPDAIVTNVVVYFGDGQQAVLGELTSSVQVTHLFQSSGVKTVTATATDSDGNQSSSSTQVAVGPLQVSLTVAPSTIQPGSLVTLTATPSPGALIERYVWELGDGEVRETTGNTTQKAYATPGARAVSVTAHPTGGGTPATSSAWVTVTN